MALLVGVGTSEGLCFELGTEATLGRGEGATIHIADPLVSAQHAKIRRDANGAYQIVDVDSTHGTYVNGSRVSAGMLADGDEIVVGATCLLFHGRDESSVAGEQARGEAVTQVAAGLAHDFVNLLTMMVGRAELIRGDRTVPDEHRVNARSIEIAAMHATRLTRKLAMLSRSAAPEPRAIDLVQFLEEMRELVRRTLGPGIELVVRTPSRPCRIMADPIELEQVLSNLAFNARDAMEGEGRVSIELRCELLDGHDHAVLLFGDNGPGIPREIAAHVFEPFFTTKPPDRGTGLGLSIVRRVVDEARGSITVETIEGRGTTFRIAWPMTASRSELEAQEGALVLDDDDE